LFQDFKIQGFDGSVINLI